MKRRVWILIALLTLLWVKPAAAATPNRLIVRTSGGLLGLQSVCALLGCNVLNGLDGAVNQLFLVAIPNGVDPNILLSLLRAAPGVVDAELDQLLGIVGGQARASTPPAGLWDRSPVSYYGSTVWNGYVNQPAAGIVRLAETQGTYHVTGTGIVADIDTGVDFTHPALQHVLLPGYDFTRNQPYGSELADAPASTNSGNGQPGQVNQSTVAVLDQSTVAVLDSNNRYAAFGHGTMVLGIIHLVAPKALLMPLKAFHPDGTGYLSDVLRAVYYGVQNHAKVINMSFDFPSYSPELAKSMNYANRAGVICVASAGNDGKDELVYPAAFTNLVMGIASTSDWDTRSSFSNYGQDIVWMAAPGEAIVTTYPFGSYAAGWGTSFSSPFVSGGVALLLSEGNANQYQAAQALAHAKYLSPDLGHGRLDLYQAVSARRAALGLH
jgi:subtilisin family serine protease